LKKIVELNPNTNSDLLFDYKIDKIRNFGRAVEIKQIEFVWSGLAGTLNGQINIYQKTGFSEVLIKSINLNSNNGSDIFLLNNYNNKIKINYTILFKICSLFVLSLDITLSIAFSWSEKTQII